MDGEWQLLNLIFTVDLGILVSLLHEFLLLIVIAVLDLDRVKLIECPVLLGSLCSLDIVVGFLFQIMQFQVPVRHDVELSQLPLLGLLASLFLQGNQPMRQLTFGGSGPGLLSG